MSYRLPIMEFLCIDLFVK